MKTLVILLVTVAAASGLRMMAGQGQAIVPQPAGGLAAGAGAAGGAAKPVNYGPKVYGPGANNLWALPPNPFTINRAIAIANSVPNVLVRLDLDGEVVLTNQYGQEVDVTDQFGREIEYEL